MVHDPTTPGITTAVALLAAPLAALETTIATALTITATVTHQTCSWNTCNKEAVTGRVVSPDFIPVYVCSRHNHAITQLITRPAPTPATNYWQNVFTTTNE